MLPIVVLNDTQLVATASSPGVDLDSDTLLYIQPTENQVLPIGFTGNNIEEPADATTDDFNIFEKYLVYEGSNGLAVSFRLKETQVSGVYQFFWDTSNLRPANYLSPVVQAL